MRRNKLHLLIRARSRDVEKEQRSPQLAFINRPTSPRILLWNTSPPPPSSKLVLSIETVDNLKRQPRNLHRSISHEELDLAPSLRDATLSQVKVASCFRARFTTWKLRWLIGSDLSVGHVPPARRKRCLEQRKMERTILDEERIWCA